MSQLLWTTAANYETIKITLDNNFISMKKYTPFFTVALVLFSLSSLGQVTSPVKINAELRKTTEQLVAETHLITEERKEQLIELGDFLIEQRTTSKATKVLFVCTHNSRRSHISDTWFQYGLVYYGISGYQSFSGGLEATAFNPNAIGALERAGFSVAFDKKIVNPVVSVSPGHYPVWQKQSKVYTHATNPKQGFIAVMVCSDADQSCPVVDGAVGRFALPYDDPRHFDGTPSQDLKYDETVAQIGRDFLFLTSYMKQKLIVAEERTAGQK